MAVVTKSLTANRHQAPIEPMAAMARPNHLAINTYHHLVPMNANTPLYRATAAAVLLLAIHGAIPAIQKRPDKAHRHHAISTAMVRPVMVGEQLPPTMNSHKHRNGEATRHKHLVVAAVVVVVAAVAVAAANHRNAATIPIHCLHREAPPPPLAIGRLALWPTERHQVVFGMVVVVVPVVVSVVIVVAIRARHSSWSIHCAFLALTSSVIWTLHNDRPRDEVVVAARVVIGRAAAVADRVPWRRLREMPVRMGPDQSCQPKFRVATRMPRVARLFSAQF
jgi:hypothetical protein